MTDCAEAFKSVSFLFWKETATCSILFKAELLNSSQSFRVTHSFNLDILNNDATAYTGEFNS